LHAGAAVAVAVLPSSWPWALATVAGNHLFNAAQALAPAGQLLGPALARLPLSLETRNLVALTFDDGPDPDITPRVLDALDQAGARATFFCIGERVLRHPQLTREILVRGHAVENHSHTHSPLAGFWGPGRWQRDIADAQRAISDATGVEPVFFRPPFGVRTPLLEPALAALGVHCAMWSSRAFDTLSDDAEDVLRRLQPSVRAGSIVLLHDGIALLRRCGSRVVLDVLPRLLQALAHRGLRSIDLRSAIAD